MDNGIEEDNDTKWVITAGWIMTMRVIMMVDNNNTLNTVDR